MRYLVSLLNNADWTCFLRILALLIEAFAWMLDLGCVSVVAERSALVSKVGQLYL